MNDAKQIANTGVYHSPSLQKEDYSCVVGHHSNVFSLSTFLVLFRFRN